MKVVLDKERVAEYFGSCLETYEDNATVQQEISRQFFNLLSRYEISGFSRILEIGCCTGFLTELICSAHSVKTIWLNDIVPEFCSVTAERIKENVKEVRLFPGDIEEKILPKGLDIVLSSSTFQWLQDLERLFARVYGCLNEGGILAFSLFGPGTMEEIRSLTGRGLPYLDHSELQKITASFFDLVHIHRERKCIYLPSVRAVLRHIQKTGVGGLGRSGWGVSEFRKFESEYKARFETDLGIPVSYVSTFVIARKTRE
ncbi:methyltransferase domain-containing protein [Desulfomarina sp.]